MKIINSNNSMRLSALLWFLILLTNHKATAFVLPPLEKRTWRSYSDTVPTLQSTLEEASDDNDSSKSPLIACLFDGSIHDENDVKKSKYALTKKRFDQVYLMSQCTEEQTTIAHVYKFQKATGMLQHVSSPEENQSVYNIEVPKWVPIVSDMETVLISNGWSFLDPDESEPMSAFDVDAANIEGTYKPKWGKIEKPFFDDITSSATVHTSTTSSLHLSTLGFDLKQMTIDEIELHKSLISNDMTVSTLLHGTTDPPNVKRTHNGIDFTGPTGQSDIKEHGVFTCAIGGLPLFSSLNLSPTTASSGWLSFSRPIASDHIVLIQPENSLLDRRVEVICAKSRGHLGHYFGPSEGYCINASALNFCPASSRKNKEKSKMDTSFSFSSPISWRTLSKDIEDEDNTVQNPTINEQVREATLSNIMLKKIAFGAGCFWHIEAAFRRLPGVVDTAVGYAGGTTINPTYEDVCHGNTGHAEVVLVEYDSNVISTRVLVDAFLSLHDPTKVRAHGKHAAQTGQYRSCIFIVEDTNDGSDGYASSSDTTGAVISSPQSADVRVALDSCEEQLKKPLSTELLSVKEGMVWFWKAEDRHQRHEEKRHKIRKTNGSVGGKQEATTENTLSLYQWLDMYGKRAAAVLGSAETLNYI